MRRDLLRRLEKLEERFLQAPPPLLRTVWITECIDESRRQQMADGECIVLDWDREVNSEVFARERITADPNDQGRRCESNPPWSRGYGEYAAPLILEIPADPRIPEPGRTPQ